MGNEDNANHESSFDGADSSKNACWERVILGNKSVAKQALRKRPQGGWILTGRGSEAGVERDLGGRALTTKRPGQTIAARRWQALVFPPKFDHQSDLSHLPGSEGE